MTPSSVLAITGSAPVAIPEAPKSSARSVKRAQITCTCTAYHFPHRLHSGACKHGDMPYLLRRALNARNAETLNAPSMPGLAKCAAPVVDFSKLAAEARALATGKSVTYRDDAGHKRIALAGPSVKLSSWNQGAADQERADLQACCESYVRADIAARARRIPAVSISSIVSISRGRAAQI